MDAIQPTPSRLHEELPWSDEAKAMLDKVVEEHPVLVRISAAKRLRDAAERDARAAGADEVTPQAVSRARGALAGPGAS
jgi:chlorophyllide a reductase subunit Z